MNVHMNKICLSVLLLLLAYCAVFANSGLPDVGVMEARNIVTAREMVVENNWLIPTMNGEIRIAKPPLPTWLTAILIAAGVSDDNLAAMRLPAGIAAMVMMLFIYLLVAKLTGDPVVPFICAAVMISSEFLISMSKQASWDIFCHTFMLGAIWLLVSGWQRKENGFHLFCFAGIFMGLSFMSKGPVAFHSMLLPFLLSYLCFLGYRDVARQWRGGLLSIIICIVVAGMWPYYLYLNIPELLLNVEAGEVRTWVEKVSKPPWYYISFPVHAGLWVGLFIAALVYPLTPGQGTSFSVNKNYKLLLSWILLTVILLTIVPKKSTHYLFPVIVPISILTGMYVKHLIKVFGAGQKSVVDRVAVTAHGALLILVTMACSAFMGYEIFHLCEITTLNKVSGALIFGSLTLLTLFFLRKLYVSSLITTSIVTVCLFCAVMPPIIAHRVHHRSFMVLLQSRAETAGKELSFYSTYPIDIKEIWAIGQRVKTIDPAKIPSLPRPLALFSKEDLAPIMKKIPEGNRRTIPYKDTASQEMWYLSEVW